MPNCKHDPMYKTACCDCCFYEENERKRLKALRSGKTTYVARVGNMFHWNDVYCDVHRNPLDRLL